MEVYLILINLFSGSTGIEPIVGVCLVAVREVPGGTWSKQDLAEL